ncbi:hypothetical protein [Desulfogranum marinum]|uniref:hypothetical protein n=1 Tax=Desulfogranum marinum TaxID=453220 RepID=UPI0029C8B372|nr:hypothetical protein [Desulfogranum marinum]
MKKTRVSMKVMCVLAVCVFSFFLAAESSLAKGMGKGATPRPLSDFIDNQGQGSSFFPPVGDYVGWADASFITFALVDYAGVAAQYLIEDCGITVGTKITGSVVEFPLPDGKAKVQVVLHTKNAMGFAQSIEALANNDFDFNATETIFGNKAVDVCSGAEAAIGQSRLKATFTINAGDSLPDLMDVIYTGDYVPWSLDFKAKIFEGKSQLEVDQKATADGVNEIWAKEEINIKEK